MAHHLQREIEQIKRDILKLSAFVEQNVATATKAFIAQDENLVEQVIASDLVIDKIELDLSENCLKSLALYQPLASDLRFIVSIVKIAGILERTGDLAENLARKGRTLAQHQEIAIPMTIFSMAEQAQIMLKDAIDSLVASDSSKARKVIDSDPQVNDYKRQVRQTAENAIIQNPTNCRQWLAVIAASRNLERIADMAVNIATQIIYSVEGKIVRHGTETE